MIVASRSTLECIEAHVWKANTSGKPLREYYANDAARVIKNGVIDWVLPVLGAKR